MDHSGRGRIRGTDVTEYLAANSAHCGLMSANFTTLPHFSVSSAISSAKSAGEPASTVPPRSASRAFIVGSARATLISLLSVSMILAGVFLGAPRPPTRSPQSLARTQPRSGCPAAPSHGEIGDAEAQSCTKRPLL